MAYQRLILHYGYDPTDFLGILSDEAIAGCWFDLHRQGGCGSGELRLKTEFRERGQIQPGHWIACEYSLGERWYLGRVEEVQHESPAGVRIQLEGPGIELNEVYPGALTATLAGAKPHVYARVDQFSADPDRAQESMDVVFNSRELLMKLLQQYVVPRTKIRYVPELLESGPLSHDITSLKFHGEETVRSLLKDLAMRARNASWGVDAEGRFFFLQQRNTVLAGYQENIDLVRLHETRSRDILYNRLTLTGDYIYDRRDYSSQIARRSYRWRGNYRIPDSIETHGERRIRLWVPWIRTAADSRSFAQEFFRVYAYPIAHYFLETKSQTLLPLPWQGRVEVWDRQGRLLARRQPETIRVQFDHTPRFQVELGPVDPHQLWSEPAHDERWELPDEVPSGFGEEQISSQGPPSLESDENSSRRSSSQRSTESEVISLDSLSSAISEASANSDASEQSEYSENSSEIYSTDVSSGGWITDSSAEEESSYSSEEADSSEWSSGVTSSYVSVNSSGGYLSSEEASSAVLSEEISDSSEEPSSSMEFSSSLLSDSLLSDSLQSESHASESLSGGLSEGRSESGTSHETVLP